MPDIRAFFAAATVAVSLAIASPPALADAGGSGGGGGGGGGAEGGGGKAANEADAAYAAAVKMVMREDFANAIPALEKLTSSRSNDPDVFNFLGFSLRKTGKLDEAKLAYERALSLSPNHRGANEYMGELYLMLNDLPKAEEHLAKLDRLCFFGCEEYTDLKQAIAQYKAKKGLAQRAAATADTGSKADSGGMADPMR